MIEITNKTRYKLSKREVFLFNKITKRALGAKYDLSLVICGDKISHKHNVLSYALTKTSGEILLNPSRRGKYSLPQLFAHACAHLTGLDHSPLMDRLEKKLLK